TPEEICLFDFSGNPREADRGFTKPVELPLHGETLRSRADANVVVHAHPPAVLAATLANLDLVPAFGSFNIPANQIAMEGIPIYPRSILISSREIALDMLATMGDHRACVLRGHGITVVGTTLESALLSALNVNTLAQVALEIAKTGLRAVPIPEEDQALVPKVSKFSPDAGWKFYEAKLRRYGFDK
ncbi:MAG: class II aldolase/adducin family protein, partial [Acidimicrobiaceae bacterium]|nr:class II aldolase/adducin family protein [Acidimicrobiaceae bacterium]